MQRTDFEYDLPAELIAQVPTAERAGSRLLHLDGASGRVRDRGFRELADLLEPGDLLVFNDTRVIPARVEARKASGGRVEVLLERIVGAHRVLVHLRGGGRLRPGATLALPGGVAARFVGRSDDLFELELDADPLTFFEREGSMPLPPYITRAAGPSDTERYQTIYAREPGAVAAPTAGLHFDADIFDRCRARGIERATVTLHVGAGTFQPVRVEDPVHHRMHGEIARLPAAACDAIAAARTRGGRVVAVGTTVVRTLESAAATGRLEPFEGETRLFIRPGFRFRIVDALVTNFHLPGSTLIMLVSAFGGHDAVMAAYRHAVRERYRFFSYGDAMYVTPPAAVRAAGTVRP
jgi:S-adenosylmethionine:tRNA ribosyltransferase-isomerase